MKQKKPKTGIPRLLEISGERKGYLAWATILSICSSVFSLAPIIIIYFIVVELIKWKFNNIPIDQEYIWTLSYWTLGSITAWLGTLYVSIVLSHIAAYDILYKLRKTVTKHIGTLPMGFFSSNHTGKLKTVLTDDVENTELFIAHHLPDAITGIVSPILTISFLFFMDWRLALFMLVPLPFGFYAVYKSFGGKNSAEKMRSFLDTFEQMNSTVIEYVRGMPVIKVFNQTVKTFARYQNNVDAYRKIAKDWGEESSKTWGVAVVVLSSSLFFILPAGVYYYINGTLELSTLVLFLIMGIGWFEPIMKFVNLGPSIVKISEGVKRLDSIMNEESLKEPEISEIPKDNSLTFENVSFTYDKKEILSNINISFGKGSFTALVGPSGAGKSTIANLIPRLWDIEHGEIKIGGVNIKNIKFNILMNYIGFVFQDVYMYTDTIYENIKMGNVDATKKDIFRASKAAQCHEFIMNLPNGYDTIIGEGGKHHLSGGEAQRISIARVILKDAPILVLDEATAYADAENESKIQKAFNHLMKNKTVIVIAHRLSTITNADNIIVIDRGEVAEQGTHKELLNNKNIYSKMWIAHTESKEWNL